MVVAFVIVSLFTSGGIEASSSPRAQTLYGSKTNQSVCERCQVLVRTFSNPSAVQIDVDTGDGSVSFIIGWGVGHRAVCEMVFIDETTWFGFCGVHDYQFGSFEELMEERPRCRDCVEVHRYFISANLQSCGARFLGSGNQPVSREELIVQVALEISNWRPEDALLLKKALVLVGNHGCPKIGQELLNAFGIEGQPVFAEDDFQAVTELPDAITIRLNHDRLDGLTQWMEHAADRIP